MRTSIGSLVKHDWKCASITNYIWKTFYEIKKFLTFLFIFERQRETEHERGRGRERGRPRIRSGLQALSCQHRAGRGAWTHGPWDHDLSCSCTLNRLGHPGAPKPENVLSGIMNGANHVECTRSRAYREIGGLLCGKEGRGSHALVVTTGDHACLVCTGKQTRFPNRCVAPLNLTWRHTSILVKKKKKKKDKNFKKAANSSPSQRVTKETAK